MKLSKQVLILLLCCLLVQFTAQADSYGPASQSDQQPPAAPVQQSPQELQQLVAPIALYPDALVAQILAASTYPTEIVEADRWIERHSDLKGEKLAKEVDKQDWDPSVKALAQFPSVLENMDKNLSWTSSLGEAYANGPEDVTSAVQEMRQQAQKAGHLNSNEQERVTTQGSTVVIEPVPKKHFDQVLEMLVVIDNEHGRLTGFLLFQNVLIEGGLFDAPASADLDGGQLSALHEIINSRQGNAKVLGGFLDGQEIMHGRKTSIHKEMGKTFRTNIAL